MNIENAKQYRHLIREIAMLEDNIKELKAKYDKPVFEEPLADLISLLEDRKEKCQQECKAFEDWIVSIPDKRMQLMIFSRFVEGLSWYAVAVKTGGSVDSVKTAVRRYFDKEVHA